MKNEIENKLEIYNIVIRTISNDCIITVDIF